MIKMTSTLVDVIEFVEGEERKRPIKSPNLRLLQHVQERMSSQKTVLESLNELLLALREKDLISRIYRKKGKVCQCVAEVGLPKTFLKDKAAFYVSETPILQQTIEAGFLYHDPTGEANIASGPDDPMTYAKQMGLVGTVCVPYFGRSEDYPNEISGALVVNYDPEQIVITDKDLLFLDSLSRIVIAGNISRLLERKFLREQRDRLKKTNDELCKEMLEDYLTLLLNGKAFRIQRTKCFDEAVSQGNEYHLIYMDGDKFKEFNDSYGHEWGDRIIAGMGLVIRNVMELANDKFGAEAVFGYRLGGDETAVICKLNEEDTCCIAEDILHGMKDVLVPEGARPVKLSQGICSSLRCSDAEDWSDKADRAMYQAKSSGGGRACVYMSDDST